MLIPRLEYLKRLLAFKDKQLIKIVTDVRRSGKSTLLELFQGEIGKQGVSLGQIQSINLEDPLYRDLLDWVKLVPLKAEQIHGRSQSAPVGIPFAHSNHSVGSTVVSLMPLSSTVPA